MRTEDERSSPADMLAYGQLLIDIKGREARLQGRRLDLTRLEFDLLAYLAAHPGWVVSPDELYEQVWGYQWGADRRLISVHMGNLRRKLGGSGAKPGLIQTVRGAGYKLVLPCSVETPPTEAERSAAPPRPSGRAPLVGRDGEQRALEAALEAALAGKGGLVLLVGEAGIGKTRLAQELASTAEPMGVTVLWGHCLDSEGLPAYWPWLQVLRALRERLGIDGLLEHAGVEVDALRQILPELRAEPVDDSTILPSISDQYHLFESLSRLLVRLARKQPYLLVLDDLPWADQSSLRLLQVLAPELSRGRILLVATARNTDITRGHLLGEIMPSLHRAGAFRMEVGALSEQAVGELVEATAGTPAEPQLVSAVAAESLGNPLHVCELVRLLLQSEQPEPGFLALSGELPLPPTIREVMASRLARISAGCRELLSLCALGGKAMSLALLRHTAHQGADVLLGLVEEATDAGLLEEEPATGRYRFSHPLVQETLVGRLTRTVRAQLHARLGESLVEIYESELESYLPEVAHHFYEAAPLGYGEQAAVFNLRAGRQALRQLAFERAAGDFQRGLEALAFADTPAPRLRAELLLAFCEARAAAFDPSVRDVYPEATSLARVVGAPDLLARAALGFEGRTLAPYSVDVERVSLVEEALAALPTADSSLRVRLMSLLARGLADLAGEVAPTDDPLSRRRRKALCDDSVSMARRLGDRSLLAHALNARWYALYSPDNTEARLADAEEALTLVRLGTDPILRLYTKLYWAWQMMEIENLHEAAAQIESCGELADRSRVPVILSVLSSFLAGRAMWQGNLQEALSLNIQGATPWRDQKDWMGAAMRLIVAFQVEALRRDPAHLETLEPAIRALIPPDPLGWAWRCRLALLLAMLPTRRGEARALFEELAARDFQDLPREQGFVLFAAHLGETAALLGDVGRAATLYRLLLPYEKRSATAFQFFDGPVSHFLGLLSMTLENLERAEAHFEDSIERASRLVMPPYEVRSTVSLAEMLIRQGRLAQRYEARRRLESALPRAEAMGMVGYASRARELVREAGETRSVSRAGGRPARR